ncbi:MAG: AcvB/VirJ family lysyl-phosphatidylglycerol hydrolase [Bacteroidota bacterium]
MKQLLIFSVLFVLSAKALPAMVADTIRYGNFGKVTIYKPASSPDALVLFISGESGWEPGFSNLATRLAKEGALVAGIDSRRLLVNLKKEQDKCFYPAGDCESLSLYLQKKYKIHNYLKPILMGHSSGATLAYGILAQAPSNTFKGAISMAFSPELKSDKPLCEGTGLKIHPLKTAKTNYLEPSGKLTAPFIAICGTADKNCSISDLTAYMKTVSYSELVPLPNAGHGLKDGINWLPQLLIAYAKIKKAPTYAELVASGNPGPKQPQLVKLETDLPLIILPAARNDTLPLILFISGDGGWTSFDEGVSEKLIEKGIPVIGLDAQKYFWQARTPDETSAEITKVLHHYLAAWNKKSFVLCGYSFGADIIPYLLTRLPADLAPLQKSAVMMSPDQSADFEIHVADMLNFGSSRDKYNVLAEIKKSASKHVVCIFGKEESSEPPKLFKTAGATIRLLPGDHHYENDFSMISREIVNTLKSK